jgi:hypothetical protein
MIFFRAGVRRRTQLIMRILFIVNSDDIYTNILTKARYDMMACKHITERKEAYKSACSFGQIARQTLIIYAYLSPPEAPESVSYIAQTYSRIRPTGASQSRAASSDPALHVSIACTMMRIKPVMAGFQHAVNQQHRSQI